MKKIIISLLVALTVFSSVLFVGCGKVSGIEGTYKVIGARYEAIYPDSDFDVLDEEEETVDLGETLEGVTLTADLVVIKIKRNNKFEVTNNNSQDTWKGTYRYENGELFFKNDGEQEEIEAEYNDGKITIQMGVGLAGFYKIMVTLEKV